MKSIYILFFFYFFLLNSNINAKEEKMILELKNGNVEIELFSDVAPNHVKRFKTLAANNEYNGVIFHRVIDGFMAQTGDVQFGNPNKETFNTRLVGTGSSNLPNLKAEFSNIPHERGTLSMARSQDPNSANSQFFICFEAAPHLDRNYSAFGKVVKGMEFIDKIKKGDGPNGAVTNEPDQILKIYSTK